MLLHLKTRVDQNYKEVFNGFNRELFLKLAPPYPRVKLVRFDGSKPGDLVEIEMHTGFKVYKWNSLITAEQVTDTQAYFIDEGKVLPPPLKKWKHKHLIKADGTGSVIHDIITFETGIRLLDLLLYPAMLVQFSLRKPIYKKIFKV